MSKKNQQVITLAQSDHAKPISGKTDTAEKMRRKGAFLVRQFGNPQGPLLQPNGKSTALALSALAWGEAAPKNEKAAHLLAKKGEELLAKASHSAS
jgi:hypothetical protein